MEDHRLRHELLPWVQKHFIQRYSDKSVVSHNEAVEELVDIVMAADLPEGTTNYSWQCASDKHDWCSGKDKAGHPCHCECNHPERSVEGSNPAG